ncbi:MAG TPA: PAS domain-containing protein, partial [Chthoniobacteraceae bacterium]
MSDSAFLPDVSAAEEIGLHRGMLDDFPTMVWAADLEGNCTYLNRAWVQFTGEEHTDPAEGWVEQIHPDDRAGTQQRYISAIRRRLSFELQYRLLRHDGVYRWVADRGNPTRDAEGHCTGFIGFCYDATEGREADDARHDVEEQVRLLSQATRDMIWSWDSRSGRVVHNAAFAEALGSMPAPYGDTLTWWKERVHEEDRERVVGAFRQAVRQGDPDVSYQYRFCRRDGTYAFIDDRVCFVRDDAGQVVRVVSAMRDISQRRIAEEAQRRFARILEATSDVVGMASPEGRLIYLNDEGRHLLALGSNDPLDGRHLEALHPEWANEIIRHEGIPTALAKGRWAGETALIGADEREIPVSQVILSHANPGGVVEFLSTIIRDISERKREEVARIEWANRYDAAIRASGQLLFDWNTQTNDVTYAGDIQRLLGYSASEMAGGLSRFRELIHPDDIGAFDQEVSRVIATRDPARLQFRILRRDGVEVLIDAKGYFFLDREGHIGRMVGFLADVTHQQRAEVALSEAHELLEARVEQRTAELARTYSVIQDRALQQGTVAQLGQRALAGASLDELFAEATTVVRETLKTDLCAVLDLDPEEQFLSVRSLAGWSVEPQDSRIPKGRQSLAGYALLTGEPVIVDDMETETRFEVTPRLRSLGAKSGIGVLIQAGSQPIGVLCAKSLQHRKFTQDDVHYLQSIANVLTAAITRQQAEQRIRFAQEQAETANRA